MIYDSIPDGLCDELNQKAADAGCPFCMNGTCPACVDANELEDEEEDEN